MAFPYPYPGPVPLYNNVPINPQYYAPSQFYISTIQIGNPTRVGTTVNSNYVVGQQVRFIIPPSFGVIQLNGMTGYVIPTSIDIVEVPNSVFAKTIAGGGLIPAANLKFSFNLPSTSSLVPGTLIVIVNSAPVQLFIEANPPDGTLSSVGGGTGTIDYTTGAITIQTNPVVVGAFVNVKFDYFPNIFTTTEIDVDIDSSHFDPFISSSNPNQPQILAIGDISSGAINSSGSMNLNLNVPGSFINISPL
jgi:hypothetical protein